MSLLNVGVLEEIVLLHLMASDGFSGTSKEIKNSIETIWERSLSQPATHTVLKRLEKKGFVTSKWGEKKNVQGGKKNKIYKLCSNGFDLLKQLHLKRNELWENSRKTDSHFLNNRRLLQ